MSPSEVSFWHPVGPHGGESLDEIVRRKRSEIDVHGYTLWSFTPASEARVSAWRAELRGRRLESCQVVCCGDTTVDPHDGTTPVSWMRESSQDLRSWAPIPAGMTNYHRPPRRDGVVASAFFVTRIEAPQGLRVPRPHRWLRTSSGRWEETPVSTRGEYIVEAPRESAAGRVVRLLLIARDPFVVWLR